MIDNLEKEAGPHQTPIKLGRDDFRKFSGELQHMSSMTTLPETPVGHRLRRREAKAERKELESPRSAAPATAMP